MPALVSIADADPIMALAYAAAHGDIETVDDLDTSAPVPTTDDNLLGILAFAATNGLDDDLEVGGNYMPALVPATNNNLLGILAFAATNGLDGLDDDDMPALEPAV